MTSKVSSYLKRLPAARFETVITEYSTLVSVVAAPYACPFSTVTSQDGVPPLNAAVLTAVQVSVPAGRTKPWSVGMKSFHAAEKEGIISDL